MERLLVRLIERVSPDAVRAYALARLRRTIPVRRTAPPLTVDEGEHPLVAFDQRGRVAEEGRAWPDAEARVVNAELIRHPVRVGDLRRVLPVGDVLRAQDDVCGLEIDP